MRKMMINRGAPVLIGLLFAAGCASYPTVTYLQPSSPDAAGAIKYNLQGSLVTLGKIKAKGTGEAGLRMASDWEKENKVNTLTYDPVRINSIAGFKENDIHAIVTATEAKKHCYAIKPNESILTKTNVSVSYIDNTGLIKSIGTSFEDNRIKAIEAIGGIIVTAVKTVKGPAPSSGEELVLPVVIDLSEIDEAESQPWKQIPGYKSWWYKIELLKPEKEHDNRLKLADFNKHIGEEVRYLAYSGCQDAKLKVAYSQNASGNSINDPEAFELSLRIANPNYLSTLNFPVKGSISMHSVCGADIKAETSKTASNLDIAEALVKQAEAIYKAQQSAAKKAK
jgi:hypothetical protein